MEAPAEQLPAAAVPTTAGAGAAEAAVQPTAVPAQGPVVLLAPAAALGLRLQAPAVLPPVRPFLAEGVTGDTPDLVQLRGPELAELPPDMPCGKRRRDACVNRARGVSTGGCSPWRPTGADSATRGPAEWARRGPLLRLCEEDAVSARTER